MSGEKQSALPDGFAVKDFDRNDDFIKSRIFTIRGVQVVLDRDLAELYGVQTKVLNQAVKRNANRFPPEFMFALAKDETEELVTNCDRFIIVDGKEVFWKMRRRNAHAFRRGDSPQANPKGAQASARLAERPWPSILRRHEDGCDVHPVDHGEDLKCVYS